MWLIFAAFLGMFILAAIWIIRAAIWVTVFAVVFCILGLFATCRAAETPAAGYGYMQNKAGGLVVLTQRGSRECRKPWRNAFTTNAQNQVIRQTCWRPDGKLVNFRLTATGDDYMVWPANWFTFEDTK